MKKALILFLTLALCLSVFAGCGGGGTDAPATNDPASSGSDNSGEITGEYFDAGEVKAIVPNGWKAFPVSDVFAEEEDAMMPDAIQIAKGAKDGLDLFSCPYLHITYYGPDTTLWEPDSSWYDNPVDLEPMTIGNFTWKGFTGESLGTKIAVIWAEGSNNQQYQVSAYVDAANGTISLDDPDVQAIIASIQPSAGPDSGIGGAAATEPSEEPAVSDDPAVEAPAESLSVYADYWAGDWYGWWAIDSATGIYEELAENGICFDAYANIEVYDDDTGFIKVWDTETGDGNGEYLATCNVSFGAGTTDAGCMMSDTGTFFNTDEWLPAFPSPRAEITHADWIVDPGASNVSHFDHMIEIQGRYYDPTDDDNRIDYLIYLRPWGTDWEDVKYGDTSDCIYSDMMPLYYDDWYLPLLEKGATKVPETYLVGYSYLDGGLPEYMTGGSTAGSTEEPAPVVPDSESDGIVDFDTLKAGYAWLSETTRTTGPDGFYLRPSVEEVVQQLGKAGKVHWPEDWTDSVCFYKWMTDDGADFLTITFELDNGVWEWSSTSYTDALAE